MSAPNEVWISEPYRETFDLIVNKYEVVVGDVRYLRADLTCGGCAVPMMPVGRVAICPRHFRWTEESVWPEKRDPSCMAFVAKGGE